MYTAPLIAGTNRRPS